MRSEFGITIKNYHFRKSELGIHIIVIKLWPIF
jgi:hypothetical protein